MTSFVPAAALIFGMLQIARRHVEEIVGNRGIVFRDVSEADALHQPHGRFDDRFGGKPMGVAVFKAEISPARWNAPIWRRPSESSL